MVEECPGQYAGRGDEGPNRCTCKVSRCKRCVLFYLLQTLMLFATVSKGPGLLRIRLLLAARTEAVHLPYDLATYSAYMPVRTGGNVIRLASLFRV